MKYYDIPDEATWNSVVGSLGDTASNPDERIIFCIRDNGIFANLLKATLKSSEEVSK